MLDTDTSFGTELPPGLKQALEYSDGFYGHSWLKQYFPQFIYIIWLSQGIWDFED